MTSANSTIRRVARRVSNRVEAISRGTRLLACLLVVALFGGFWLVRSQSLLTGVVAALAAIGVLRLWSLIRSDMWIWQRGFDYLDVVSTKPSPWDPRPPELLAVYRDHRIRGAFFPFGIRAITLKVAYESATGPRRACLTAAFVTWKYYIYGPLISFVIFLIVIVAQPSRVSQYLLFVTGLMLCAGALVIAGEAALAYFTFGSWSLAYHRFDVAEQRGTAEISALAGGVITALAANASTMALVGVAFNGFEKGSFSPHVASVGTAFYFTLTAFTGNGDAGPLNWPAYTLMALLYTQAAAYLLVVISLLLDSLGDEPGFHVPWSGRRRRAARRRRR